MATTRPRPAAATRVEPAPPGGTAEVPLQPAPMKRRLAAGIIDIALLVAVSGLIMDIGLSFGAPTETLWFELVWWVVAAPLYFALYHAFGTGATPGQLELRIGVRDEESGGLIGPGRALARVFGSLLSVLLVVPALLSLRDLDRRPGERSLADRLTRSTSVPIALHGKAAELAAPTAPELVDLFEPAHVRGHVRRGVALVKGSRGLLVRSVAAVYFGLLAIVALLAGLTLADNSASGLESTDTAAWIAQGVVLLVSGLYWTQAVIVHASESVRVGRHDVTVDEVLRRSFRRANALSALLLLVLAAVMVAASIVLPLVAVVFFAYRFAFVVPALVLEDTRVLGSFARSFELTERRWREIVALVLKSAAILGAAGLVSVGFAAIGIAAVWSSDNLAALVAGAVTGLALACVPVVYALAVVGAAWSLLYEDLRRELPPGTKRKRRR